MRKRAFFVLLAVVALVISSLACGNGAEPEVREPDAPAVEEPVEEAVEEPAEEPTEEEPSVGTTRGNPAPAGYEVTISDMTFVVEDAVRPADDIAYDANMFNVPEEGKEYVMVTLSVTCEKSEDDTCSLNQHLNLSVIGSAGVARDAAMVAGVSGQLPSDQFYGGATISGTAFFEVGQDETDLVLRYEPLFGTTRAFLALPE